jgi:histidinol-phosphate aminotransferase
VLIEFSGRLTAEMAYLGLMEQGYITRWLPGQGLPQCLRITIGHADQMDAVAAALAHMAAATA